MSTHEAKVVRIETLEPHPKADKLNIAHIWGYHCVVRKDQFKVGDLACYIEPDTLLKVDRPEFSFLKKEGSIKTHHRVRAAKYRGYPSTGLLIPVPEGFSEGDNLWEHLELERYEPEIHSKAFTSGNAEKGPDLLNPKYDLENLKKYMRLFNEGEEVVVTPKIHGSNARYVWHENRMWCGSRTQWKVKDDHDLWWKCLAQNPWIERACKEFPDTILYGEVFGPNVQKGFHYGLKNEELGFLCFDMSYKGQWTNNHLFFAPFETFSRFIKFVPLLYKGPFDLSVIAQLAECKEDINNAGHIREGVVVKPSFERYDVRHGRVALKYVSDQYLEKE